MYKCQLCDSTSRSGVPSFKIAAKTRPVFYPYRAKVNSCRKLCRDKSTGEIYTKPAKTDDRGGVGIENVIELTVCPTCANKTLLSNDNHSRSIQRNSKDVFQDNSRLKRVA